MPDWFYRTVAQRILFAMPDAAARGVALSVIGTLGQSRLGRSCIQFLGHMEPPSVLETKVGDMRFASPFGLGWRVDPDRKALRGLAEFGVGFLEIREGPPRKVRRGMGDELIDDAGTGERPMSAPMDIGRPILRRSGASDGSEILTLPNGNVLPVRASSDESTPLHSTRGVVLQVGDRTADGKWRTPARQPSDLIPQVRRWRQTIGADACLIVSGGVQSPADGVALIRAGADLVLIDAGLVFSGPGLVKRCNEALVDERSGGVDPSGIWQRTSLRDSWIWALALGAGLAIGGFAAAYLALTRVLLPYDEHYLGVAWQELQRSLPLVFHFMAHDRGTLAGVMIGLGLFYSITAVSGIRFGIHGARTAVIASALVGFASFFAFFGFGYFDTLHAFVAVVLFQLTVQIMTGHHPHGAHKPVAVADDRSWKLAQWGQLAWVVHAVGLLVAGATILWIGMTDIFVGEDLAFLCITAEQAAAMNERMLAVLAHDRATLGGMLLSAGVVTLLTALWCFRAGDRWLWRAMLAIGLPSYALALGVHLWVGYTDPRHLVPALAGLALWIAGLMLSYRYLRSRNNRSIGTQV